MRKDDIKPKLKQELTSKVFIIKGFNEQVQPCLKQTIQNNNKKGSAKEKAKKHPESFSFRNRKGNTQSKNTERMGSKQNGKDRKKKKKNH